MEIKSWNEIQKNEIVRKRLAKLIALKCFRYSVKLENLHGGKYPSSEKEDFSDVKVVTPYGEIPWNRLSRFNDEEMSELMHEIVNLTYTHLTELFSEQGNSILEKLKSEDKVPKWSDPELLENIDNLDQL